ncbi:lytic transglycosylase domain-containing protein [Desulfocurvus sp.]|jgi:soluble lytic murein transglycosylase|uniref:lytic transglycosylase domain-containing protein n=1 Tax=Desulfocurvus sp. TaxID=2871698 RepID=UPI0025BACEFF|nr:lytic transglycosylase domain-containing protein [Desulfocurvus sp.]MCK9239159.1 lytic transglycosylase domain-containing protein [Desulfocurvus sp.]
MPRKAAFIAPLALGAALLCAAPGADGAGMYFYKDGAGSFHFTNRPTSTTYRVFAVFKNFPDARKSDILRVVRSKADAYGLDHRLVQAVIQVESNFQPGAVSDKGAQGLMQIMPSTGADLGLADPHDVEGNIEAGVRYLRMQMDRFGSPDLALAAYNAGPGQVERYGGVPPFRETQDYVRKVLSLYKKLKGGS